MTKSFIEHNQIQSVINMLNSIESKPTESRKIINVIDFLAGIARSQIIEEKKEEAPKKFWHKKQKTEDKK